MKGDIGRIRVHPIHAEKSGFLPGLSAPNRPAEFLYTVLCGIFRIERAFTFFGNHQNFFAERAIFKGKHTPYSHGNSCKKRLLFGYSAHAGGGAAG